MKIYYNYIYLNPFKKGKFSYDFLPICFLYEPFYVGKGTGNRYLNHFEECKKKKSKKCLYINTLLKNFSREELETYIVKCCYTTSEIKAFNKERIFINQIGYQKDNSGCLTNLKDKGRKFKAKKTLKISKSFFKNPFTF